MRRAGFWFAITLPALAWGQTRIDLRGGWEIQAPGGERYPASVPSTVISAMVQKGVYPDPYVGMNLRSIPGTKYGIGANFANVAMPEDSPFRAGWWYRTEFRMPASAAGKSLWLNFEGINYRANIWLNDRRVAGSDAAAGMYRRFEFNVTGMAKAGATNRLAVEVFAPTPNDLGLTFVDWNPLPADKDMGLVGDVFIRVSGPVAVRDPFVTTHLEGSSAHLVVHARLVNATDKEVEGLVKALAGKIALSKTVRVPARGSMRVELPFDDPQPELWWPWAMGPQNLQPLRVTFEAGGEVSDRQDVTFGIREVTSELDAQKHRLFKVNGKKILIRGGGWTQDMLLRVDDEREDQELRYAREMNLNAIRLEGKLMNEHFYQACDRKGILVIAGWCCCSYWEQWKKWKPEDYDAAGEALRDQMRRLERHASVLTFLYGSDNSPDARAEQGYLKVMKEEQWPNPAVSSAAERETPGAGATGVKMSGPYDYVAPNYWLQDRERGGAFGFNTETSPGPAIPVVESIRQMLPREHRWPIDDFWNYHAGGGAFKNVERFTTALENRYGKAKDLDDYVRKSQVMAYEGERAMFEAYGRNKYVSTGVVQWMANNAWPSMIWHLYDFYLRPGGGYFGTKKANETMHVQYSYDDQSVVVVNSGYRAWEGRKVSATVYDLDLRERFTRDAVVDVPADSSTKVFTIPAVDGLSRTYFVRLTLDDQSSNFYWLSTQPDVSNWAKGDWNHTPIQTYADLKDLQNLPPAEVTISSRTERDGDDEVVRVQVANPSPHLAFFVHLAVRKGNGEDIRPIYWDDNYFELMPGEKREIRGAYPRKLMGGAKASVEVDGWNLKQ